MEQQGEKQMIAVSCACGKQFKAKPELAGRKVKCPQCHDPLEIPRPQSQQPADDRLGSLLDDLGVSQAAAANSCPHCKQPLPSEAVVCVKCGYHLQDGRQLRTKSLIRKEGLVGKSHLGTTMRADLPKTMKQLVAVSRTGGIVCLLMSVVAVCLASLAATIPELNEQITALHPKLNVVTLAGPGTLSGIAGIMSLVVSNQAKQGLPSARTWGFLTGLLMLPLVPVATLFGVLIICLFLHPDTKRFYR